MLKFYFNGIKENGGKLQKASYSSGKLKSYPEGTITIYGKNSKGFSAGVHESFMVENGTDIMTDYFENDRIRVVPSHPLYNEVKKAMLAQSERLERKYTKRSMLQSKLARNIYLPPIN